MSISNEEYFEEIMLQAYENNVSEHIHELANELLSSQMFLDKCDAYYIALHQLTESKMSI